MRGVVLATAVSFYKAEACSTFGFTFLYQLCQQTAPLTAEDVGASEAAIPATHTQVGDAFLHQVEGSGEPAVTSCEGFAPGASYHGPSLQQRHHRTPIHMLQTGLWNVTAKNITLPHTKQETQPAPHVDTHKNRN